MGQTKRIIILVATKLLFDFTKNKVNTIKPKTVQCTGQAREV